MSCHFYIYRFISLLHLPLAQVKTDLVLSYSYTTLHFLFEEVCDGGSSD